MAVLRRNKTMKLRVLNVLSFECKNWDLKEIIFLLAVLFFIIIGMLLLGIVCVKILNPVTNSFKRPLVVMLFKGMI